MTATFSSEFFVFPSSVSYENTRMYETLIFAVCHIVCQGLCQQFNILLDATARFQPPSLSVPAFSSVTANVGVTQPWPVRISHLLSRELFVCH
jgi:hypothetical protein